MGNVGCFRSAFQLTVRLPAMMTIHEICIGKLKKALTVVIDRTTGAIVLLASEIAKML